MQALNIVFYFSCNLYSTQYDIQKARVLSLEDVEKRRHLAENTKKEKEAKTQARKEKHDNRLFFFVSKDLMLLEPDLIYGSNPVTPRFLPKNKNRDNSIFQHAFYDFLQITQLFLKRQLWVN